MQLMQQSVIGTLTITDDDAAPTISIADVTTANENASDADYQYNFQLRYF